jgi:hypothetical protein
LLQLNYYKHHSNHPCNGFRHRLLYVLIQHLEVAGEGIFGFVVGL